MNGFDLPVPESTIMKLRTIPYHENTKLARHYFGGVRKHERRGV
jgi:hypothetical protein